MIAVGRSPRVGRRLAVIVATAAGAILAAGWPSARAPERERGLVFTAAGDLGATADTSAVLDLAPAHGDLFVALGDLSYGALAPERAWCDYVKRRVGGLPVALVAGNHEAHSRRGQGLIDNFVAPDCLPAPWPDVVGEHGKQAYVDLPAGAAAPLARMITIAPGLDFEVGGRQDYAPAPPGTRGPRRRSTTPARAASRG